MKNSVFQAAVVSFAVLLTSTIQARADVALLIDDHQLQPIAVHLLGSVFDPSIQITQAGVGVLGTADVQFDYNSSTQLAVGQVEAFNYTVYMPFQAQVVSNTWSITLTGLDPSGGLGNVNVNSVFQSASSDGVLPTAIPGSVAVTLNQEIGFPDGSPDGTYQYVDTVPDLTTGFNAAPEPGFLPLVGIGLAGIVGYSWRRRRRQSGVLTH